MLLLIVYHLYTERTDLFRVIWWGNVDNELFTFKAIFKNKILWLQPSVIRLLFSITPEYLCSKIWISNCIEEKQQWTFTLTAQRIDFWSIECLFSRSGLQWPNIPAPRSAHEGTLEFCSRDAHLGCEFFFTWLVFLVCSFLLLC